MLKRKVVVIFCAAMAGLLGTSSASAHTGADSTSAAVDALGRPVGLMGTVVGGVMFVITLPATAIAHRVKPAAEELVLKPARHTFKRPLGQFTRAEEVATKPTR